MGTELNMIYLDWSPALKFHVRCTVHDTLATGSFDTMPSALYATSLHRIDYACDEKVEDIGQGRVKGLDHLRNTGELPDLTGKYVGYKPERIET